jgi:hypothetical protein
MKTMYICLAFMLGSNTLFAQPGLIKQPPKIPGVTNAVRNVRIHANSNTIYGANKVKTDNRKVVVKKSDGGNFEPKKKEEIKKEKGKKQKK